MASRRSGLLLVLLALAFPSLAAADPVDAVAERPADDPDYLRQLYGYLSGVLSAAGAADGPEVADQEQLALALEVLKEHMAAEAAALEPAPAAAVAAADVRAPGPLGSAPAVEAEVSAYASTAAFTLGGTPMKFRAVLEGVSGAELQAADFAATPTAAASVNPFLFKLDEGLLRFQPKPSLCVSVRGGRVRVGQDVILWTCQDTPEFKWVVVGDQIVLDSYRDYSLSVGADRAGDGSDIVIVSCRSAFAGHWVVDGDRIRYSGDRNFCLSVREGMAGDGSDLILWSCDQAWLVADWIVVGAGAAGCAAAAALADLGEIVIVVERGPSDLKIPETQQAATWPDVVNTAAVQPIRWQDGTWGAVASVLGGATAVNGGLYIEEEPDFFTDTLGSDVDLDSLYESSRYLAANLSAPLQPSSFGLDYVKALQEVNFVPSDGVKPQLRWSEGGWVAYSTINTTNSRWPRRGAAILLHERSALLNLEVLTEYQVKRVVFSGTRATGVQVVRRGVHGFLPARKGVVLAAGAIFTPQLLQISGIGEAALLRRLGVAPVVPELPVGRNFIDRPVLTVGVWSAVDLPMHIGYAVSVNKALQLTTESEAGGKVASEFTIASLAFAKPDARNEFLRWTFKLLFSTPIADILNNMIQLVALQHSPKSRGNVEAISVDSTIPPSVRANHLSDPEDMARQIVSLNQMMRLVGTDAMQQYARPKTWVPPVWPLPDFLSCFAEMPGQTTPGIVFPCQPAPGSSEARLKEYLANTVVSSYHYFGTAPVGTVLGGPDFLVRGTENLHVVDASVFAKPTRVNPQGTIMAVGHYAGKRLAALGKRRLAGHPVLV